MNAGRIFRDDPVSPTRVTITTLECDATTARMTLARHVATVEQSIRTMLQLTTEPNAQVRSDLRERLGNCENSVRTLAWLVKAPVAEPRLGWHGQMPERSPINRDGLAATRDEAFRDAKLRLGVLQALLARRAALGEALRAAQVRLDELQTLIASQLGAR
jgi:hypothetical protein